MAEEMVYKRFHVLKRDALLMDWVNAQGNLSISLREVVRFWIEHHGPGDAFYRDAVPQQVVPVTMNAVQPAPFVSAAPVAEVVEPVVAPTADVSALLGHHDHANSDNNPFDDLMK